MLDAHTHYAGDHSDCVGLLEKLNMKMLNICVPYSAGQWADQKRIYSAIANEYPSHFAWCTTFDPPVFEDADYVDRVIAGLDDDFRAGAVACKIWKNIGMEVRNPSGEYVMIDDPFFAPIFEHLQKAGHTVLMHVGEPLEWWKPLDPSSPHYDYIAIRHPEWHVYGKRGFPSHGQLIDARDNVVHRYPGIRFVGAHLGSIEHDLMELAKRFNAYSNFAVDTSARLIDLAILHASDQVQEFLMRYQDRIIYGTDTFLEARQSGLSSQQRVANIETLSTTYGKELSYFSSPNRMQYNGKMITGIGLPERVLRGIMYQNGKSWYQI